MSLRVEAVSSSSSSSSSGKKMGFDKNKLEEEENKNGDSGEGATTKETAENAVGDEEEKLARSMSHASLCTEDEEDEETKIELGPQVTLKEQLEKDKDDESLRRWKEQLLGNVNLHEVGETLEPEVKILSLVIVSPGRPDIVLPIPQQGNPKGMWFTLKEGCKYHLKFIFQVSNNIVSGLQYTNTVWKSAFKVAYAREMLGTFSPQAEPYTHEMPEESAPAGILSRGTYSAKTAFLDDDKKSYLEMSYTFDIRKEWPST